MILTEAGHAATSLSFTASSRAGRLLLARGAECLREDEHSVLRKLVGWVLTRRRFFWIVTPSLSGLESDRPAIGHTAAAVALHGGVIEVENGRAAAAGRTALPALGQAAAPVDSHESSSGGGFRGRGACDEPKTVGTR